jgi:hypothetical protein
MGLFRKDHRLIGLHITHYLRNPVIRCYAQSYGSLYREILVGLKAYILGGLRAAVKPCVRKEPQAQNNIPWRQAG